jgi:hypothetical protein
MRKINVYKYFELDGLFFICHRSVERLTEEKRKSSSALCLV